MRIGGVTINFLHWLKDKFLPFENPDHPLYAKRTYRFDEFIMSDNGKEFVRRITYRWQSGQHNFSEDTKEAASLFSEDELTDLWNHSFRIADPIADSVDGYLWEICEHVLQEMGIDTDTDERTKDTGTPDDPGM